MKSVSTTRLLIVMATLLGALRCHAGELCSPKLGVTDSFGQPIDSATAKQVIAWGSHGSGQISVPKGLTPAIAVAAGGFHMVALKANGSVVAWGSNYNYDYGQTRVPAGLNDAVAIAAGAYHTVALKKDGSVVAWGLNDDGQTRVPAGLSGVVAISAGYAHTVALKQDGTIVAWGRNSSGAINVPANLSGVVAIAAGSAHTVALKQDGSIVAWGWNADGAASVPVGLSGVVAIAAGAHTVALKQDGRVAAWGQNGAGQTIVPYDLSGVVSIAANYWNTVAIKQDGSVVAWGDKAYGQTIVPADLSGVTGIALGGAYMVAIASPPPLHFFSTQLGMKADQGINLTNNGSLPLVLSYAVEGPDADQFSLAPSPPTSLAAGALSPTIIRFTPSRLGPIKAQLKITSNDIETPSYLINLSGLGSFDLTATKPTLANSPFTYAPLRLDRQTGLMLQKITFTNTTGVSLNGLRLILSKVASGVQVYSSSAGKTPGTLEVIYSNAIKANETISFDLVYFDPKRRTAESMNPVIKAEALMEPEPDSPPVAGTEVALRSVRATSPGPWLEWNSVPKANYVVEYSDDAGKTWFSAVHRLSTSGTRMFWIDRGQPETKTKAIGVPNQAGGRFYRLKKL